VAPWQEFEIDNSVREPFDAGQIERSVEELIEFLELRPEVLAEWLGGDEEPGEPEEKEPVGGRAGASGGGPGPDPAPDPAPPTTPTLSKRLTIDRSRLDRGLLTVRASVSGPGKLTLRAELVTGSGRLTACTTSRRADTAGVLNVTCRLSDEVRRRLTTRWLRLPAQRRFQPLTGEATEVRTTVRLPRETDA
jgi:hypothetical protein